MSLKRKPKAEESPRESQAPATTVAAKMSVSEFFAQRPHPLGYVGYALEQKELAGPPQTPEERADRAREWREIILMYRGIPLPEVELYEELVIEEPIASAPGEQALPPTGPIEIPS